MAATNIVKDTNLASVLQISVEARDQALKLVDYINTVDESDLSSPETLSNVSQQTKLLNTSMSQLRGLHRAAHMEARKTKSKTGEARQEVDALHLQLQNLYYEQRHLQDEISACESFDHSYQKLPLIPVEEFLSLHPEHQDADENTLMVARIEHERAERETLEQQRQELLKRKLKLVAENKKRKDDLANLDKQLEAFIDAAQPIRTIFQKAMTIS